MNLFLETSQYVVNVPYFWITMGTIVSIAMFIGALIFNSDIRALTKSLISLTIYESFLVFVQFNRINNYYTFTEKNQNKYMAYAQMVTLVYITTFWVLGLIIGVIVSRIIRKKVNVSEMMFSIINYVRL